MPSSLSSLLSLSLSPTLSVLSPFQSSKTLATIRLPFVVILPSFLGFVFLSAFIFIPPFFPSLLLSSSLLAEHQFLSLLWNGMEFSYRVTHLDLDFSDQLAGGSACRRWRLRFNGPNYCLVKMSKFTKLTLSFKITLQRFFKWFLSM